MSLLFFILLNMTGLYSITMIVVNDKYFQNFYYPGLPLYLFLIISLIRVFRYYTHIEKSDFQEYRYSHTEKLHFQEYKIYLYSEFREKSIRQNILELKDSAI